MNATNMNQVMVSAAAHVISKADAILIAAGAGMGVDSGLPDFRGDEGFWKAYPPFKEAGLNFMSLANPRLFETNPDLAWGFYGHRHSLYSATKPHIGYNVLRRLVAEAPLGGRVMTSNVDGAFFKAGFGESDVVEVHGALSHLQCTKACGVGLLSSDGLRVDVDHTTFRAKGKLPSCPQCGSVLRPNVLMFNDGWWDTSRANQQDQAVEEWLRSVTGRNLVVVEIGAGTGIPTIRLMAERMARRHGGQHIRINLREAEGEPGTISIAMGAAVALTSIEAEIVNQRWQAA